MRQRGFDPLRDIPAVLWLMAAVVVAVFHVQVPAPRWLLIHLLLLGAVTHSIVVWSQHFADALLHNAVTPGDRRARSIRLAALIAGVLAVLVGVPSGQWWLVVMGASAVVVAVAWHGLSLLRQLRRRFGSRFAVTVRYYIAAAAILPVGVLFGTLMARGVPMEWHERLMTAHVILNVLGWMGLTVLGTLLTLWPTMLRTRIVEGAENQTRRALWPLLAGLGIAVAACLADVRPLVGVGMLTYAAGLLMLARPFVQAMRQKPPTHFPSWSVLAAMVWFTALTLALGVMVTFSSGWEAAHERVDALAPAFAVGFGAQILIGALSYLIPVSIGRGPVGVRAANAVMDKGSALRITVVNAGLPLALLPVPVWVRVGLSAAILVALAAFLPLMVLATRAARKARQAPESVGPAERPRGQLMGLFGAGLSIVVLTVAAGVALDPAALAGASTQPAAAGVAPTGETTEVTIDAADMRFSPGTITVPAGNRLVITVRNTDDREVHDLVLDSGEHTPRLAPGESAQLDVGVVGRSIEGWCSLPGHRQMGMVLHIEVPGSQQAHVEHSAATHLDHSAQPAADFVAHDPVLPALPPGKVIRRTFTVSDLDAEVAPGVRQTLWVYNGTMPGPALRGRVGDRFVIRIVNDTQMGHSIDFHAGQVAPDRPMRTLAPGESLVYRFTANHSGAWLYHCSTMPMSAHIANGMFGAVVIDPPDLPAVDRDYLLVQSELYLGEESVDVDKVMAETPDAVVFNGYANQYDEQPLVAKVGERIRIWVVDAGPNRPSSLHVVGGQFDTVFAEGGYLLQRGNAEQGGAQVMSLAPAQGGFVELSFEEPGNYPFVSHLMVDAERGAHGIIRVSR